MDARVTEPPITVTGFPTEGGEALFPSNRTAPRKARKWVGAYFLAAGRADVLDDVELIVSELVTNALRQPAIFTVDDQCAIRVRIVRRPSVHRVEVYDGNPDPPHEQPDFAPVDSPSGRGLRLVDAFAAQRGWTPYTNPENDGKGKFVWFTIERKTTETINSILESF